MSFDTAVTELRQARVRAELAIREIPAPEKIAPRSIAFAGGIRQSSLDDDDAAIESGHGVGRFVLLHDPDSAAEWGGPFRIVCYAQAPLEVELGIDPFIADVAWSWLLDALDTRDAEYGFISGTATKTLSSGFGTLEAQGDGAQIELRASWTPLGSTIAQHAEAWSELLCLLAGLPHHEGVDSISAQRARNGQSSEGQRARH